MRLLLAGHVRCKALDDGLAQVFAQCRLRGARRDRKIHPGIVGTRPRQVVRLGDQAPCQRACADREPEYPEQTQRWPVGQRENAARHPVPEPAHAVGGGHTAQPVGAGCR